MGIVVRMPLRHVRASAGTRAASRVKISEVTPADAAFSVASTADHHSAGILSRCHHLETTIAVAAGSNERKSAAMDSREGPQSSMTLLNEVISGRTLFCMQPSLGQLVPKSKDFVSADCNRLSGHTVRMEDDSEKLAESQWREEFRQRLIAARGRRTQAVMADLLGLRTNTYGKYEGGRKSMMPARLLPRFAKICGVDLVELIEGPPKEKAPARPKIVKTKPPAVAVPEKPRSKRA